MDEYEQQRLLWCALRRLISANRAIEELRSTNPAVEHELLQMRDEARREVESYLPLDATEELASRRAELREAQPGLDRDSFDFADTALLIGVSTAASILIAPFGALIVAESMIKELVKATVSGLFVGMATAAAEFLVDRRRDKPRSLPERTHAFSVAAENVAEEVVTRGHAVADDPDAGSVRGSTPRTATDSAQNYAQSLGALPLADSAPTRAAPPARPNHVALESLRNEIKDSGFSSSSDEAGELDRSGPKPERGDHSL